MKSNNLLKVAEKKIGVQQGRTLSACLTPSEIMALYKAGYKFREDFIDDTKNNIKNGACSPAWVYFTAPKGKEIIY